MLPKYSVCYSGNHNFLEARVLMVDSDLIFYIIILMLCVYMNICVGMCLYVCMYVSVLLWGLFASGFGLDYKFQTMGHNVV